MLRAKLHLAVLPLLLATLAFWMVAGLRTPERQGLEPHRFVSVPTGAEVFVDGRSAGHTPIPVHLPSWPQRSREREWFEPGTRHLDEVTPHRVELRKPGFEPFSMDFRGERWPDSMPAIIELRRLPAEARADSENEGS